MGVKAERRARGEAKIKAYMDEMLVEMMELVQRELDGPSFVAYLNAHINGMIKKKPQEASLIRTAASQLDKSMSEALSKIQERKEKEAAAKAAAKKEDDQHRPPECGTENQSSVS